MKSLIWLLVHRLSKKKSASSVQITEENVSTGKTSPLTNSKPQSGVKIDDFVPLNIVKNTPGNRETSKRPKSPFKKTNKISAITDPSSPSLGSLASILASDSEVSVRKPKKRINSPPPGAVDVDDDLWELESDLSDSGFGLSVKNVFAKSNTVDEKGEEIVPY